MHAVTNTCLALDYNPSLESDFPAVDLHITMDLTGYNSDQESRLSDQDWQVCDDNDLDSLADDSSTDDRRPQEKKAHPAVAARRSQYPRHAQTMKSSVAGTTLLETVPASSTNHAGTGMSIHMGYPILLTDIGRSIM